ncbi:MAG: Stp1/IreP family PP2C-type Ser/Thr phosphatase [Clostridiales Family XIII bacterium]|jgi:protein phosphatase|nr:Stp1/IreP family PP2C-type Ser/Thr phosphatase [Clostridiales Family XIII bacterium]
MAKMGFRTDVGKRRTDNEDALLVLPRHSIYLVADGVGGHNSGELASRKAVSGTEAFLTRNPVEAAHGAAHPDAALMAYFLRCFREINAEICALAQADPANRGMATTAVLAHILRNKLFVVNVGDSRAYLVRAEEISRITTDHSVVNDMVARGELTEEQARVHPRRNEITRALGAEADVAPDFFATELLSGDRVLLCTDGLCGELSDDDIRGIVARGANLNDTCRMLVDSANANGGSDNITVVCIEI